MSEMHCEYFHTYLDKTRPAIKIQVKVLDVPKFSKGLVNVLLLGLLMYVCYEHDPSLDSCRSIHQ